MEFQISRAELFLQIVQRIISLTMTMEVIMMSLSFIRMGMKKFI